MLKNVYDVDLKNVFDTAVADLTFFKTINEQGLLPRYLRSYQVKFKISKCFCFCSMHAYFKIYKILNTRWCLNLTILEG